MIGVSRRPAVLYVAPDIPVPHAGVFLGGSTHVMEVSRALVKNGFEVHVLCRRMSKEQPSQEEISEGILAHRVYRGIFFPVTGGLSLDKKLSLKARAFKLGEALYFTTIYRLALAALAARLIVKYDIDAVLERNSAKGIGAFPARLLKKPLVEEVIDPDLSRAAVRSADRVFAYTPKVLEGLVPADRVSITTAGVDTDRFRPMDGSAMRRKYGLEGKKVVVYVGEMSAWHGIDVLVRAMALLGDDYRALILGKNAGKLKPLATELGVMDRLAFTGQVGHDEVPAYIAAADLGAAPYDPAGGLAMDRFGFYFSPIKMFEYMACGKPIVASDIDIVRDIVRESGCGLLSRPGDPESLAAAIRALMESPDRASMGIAGLRACKEKYNWDRVGGDIAVELKRLAESRRGSQ